MIDDMQGITADGPGMSGYWYTYSDRTVPNSEPVQPRRDAGYVFPSEGDIDFEARSDGQGPPVDGGAQPYRLVDGGGETLWGVGFGMDFTVAPPDGGPIPLDECDAGQVWATDSGAYIPQSFDASGWTGIQFYARSFGPDAVPVEVHVDDDRTTPWGQVPLGAGGCNACFSSGADASACSDSFSTLPKDHPIEFPAGSWALFHVPFAWLHSGNWAGILEPSEPIHADKIYNLHFQVSVDAGAVAPFSVGVAYISFYYKD